MGIARPQEMAVGARVVPNAAHTQKGMSPMTMMRSLPQLKMIINRKLTPEDAMVECHALWSEKNGEKCKFCESQGAIGKDLISQARKILGKDEPATAKDE